MRKLTVVLIEFYQSFLSFDRGILSFFAPGGACKYEISCSEYARQSIVKHGVINGGRMAIKRIWSCR